MTIGGGADSGGDVRIEGDRVILYQPLFDQALERAASVLPDPGTRPDPRHR
ncbi:MAG TPA: hypothetical protein VF463_09590 [Sphingobium sp.]